MIGFVYVLDGSFYVVLGFIYGFSITKNHPEIYLTTYTLVETLAVGMVVICNNNIWVKNLLHSEVTNIINFNFIF